jgi:hypothetical protein
MTNKLSSTLDRRAERRNKAMPHLKVDPNHPEIFFDVLKQMNIHEGAELEVEKIENGVLFKTITSEEERVKSALLNAFISGQDQRKGIEQLAQEMQNLGIPEDSTDLDSDWWIKTIDSGSMGSLKDISMDDE